MRLLTTTIGDAVRAQLAEATRARIAVAYFNPDDQVLTALQAMPNVTVLVGSDFSINNPYKLEKLAGCHQVLQVLPDSSSGRLHAKVYLFDRDDGSRCAIVGSANFTTAGFGCNHEAAILLGRAIVSTIRPIVERMIAIDALLAGDGLIIDLAAEELGVVGRSVRRSLDILRELAGPAVFEIDETTGRHRHWYANI